MIPFASSQIVSCTPCQEVVHTAPPALARSVRIQRTAAGCLAVAILLATAPFYARTALAAGSQAQTALAAGEVDTATRLLQAEFKADPHDAQAQLLLCRADYSIELADQAVQACERAEKLNPNDSMTEMWLGRAYGQKASHANPFSAYGLAKHVRSTFEQAVLLDPGNVAALNDLAEFYINAPGVVGGGLDKATALIPKMQAVSPAAAARLGALIAEKNGDQSAAEAGFKKAETLKPTPESWVDLGFFYQRHQRLDDMEAALKQAVALDHTHDAALVDVASILTSANRSPVLAQELLKQYLASPAKSDAAPAAKVHVQLGRLDEKAGDTAAAKQQYSAALGLASQYAPARKALEALR